MPHPSNLPPELWDQILGYAAQRDSCSDFERQKDLMEGADVRRLSRFSLVSRSWNEATVKRLYSKWIYNGARHTYISLWKFLRTVVTTPQVARMVHTVNIGNWGFYPDAPGDVAQDNLDFSPHDLLLLRQAIDRVGLKALQSEILEPHSLKARDHRPLVALLLASLPNLSTLYAHVPESDPILGMVLQEILRHQESGHSLLALGRLTDLYLLQEVPLPELGIYGNTFPAFAPGNIWPVLYLTNLRKLHIYGLDMQGIASLIQHTPGTCLVQQLHIVMHLPSTFTDLDVHALLCLPQVLTSLSLHWYEDVAGPDGTAQPQEFGFHQPNMHHHIPKISIPTVSNAVQKHKDTLEYLDIYQDNPSGGRNLQRSGHFWSLRPFTRLKHLYAQSDLLLNGYFADTTTTPRLTELLPPSLQTLSLYIGGFAHEIPGFATNQIQEIVTSQASSLKLLTLEDHFAENYYASIGQEVQERFRDRPEPYPGLHQLCQDNGIRLDVVGSCAFRTHLGECHTPSGGVCRWLWRKTWSQREDGENRCYRRVQLLPG